MKKTLIATAVVAITAIAAYIFWSNIKTPAENLQSKTLSMAVYTDNNYAAKIYDASTAGLTISVKKVNAKSNEVVWVESFPALALKLFPTLENAFKPVIKIPAMSAKDVLEVSYTLTYDSKGSVLQMANTEVVTASDKGLLQINI
ncbi:MAG TPA: hypothetical protein VG738_04220 [Chitinophagaceae bacterium]|nr:hypothetical protein [Chitinophagaceae bacterium]